MLTNLDAQHAPLAHQNGNSSLSTQNLSPVSYTSQVPSPLTAITPTSSSKSKLLQHFHQFPINFIFFLCSSVPHMIPLSSASVITTSTSGLATSNNNYPHLTPIVGNHHLYQQQNSSSSMMSSDYNNSPTCYQQSFPMNMLDAAIKVENGSSMLLTRQQSNESNNSDSKALDLELKPNRQLNTMTSIESR